MSDEGKKACERMADVVRLTTEGHRPMELSPASSFSVEPEGMQQSSPWTAACAFSKSFSSLLEPLLEFRGRDANCPTKLMNRKVLLPDQFIDLGFSQAKDMSSLRNSE
jgi:hypothetical protein